MNVNQFNAYSKILKYTDKLDYYLNGHKTLISLELDLTNLCNNKCPACTGMKDKPVTLTFEQVKSLFDQLHSDFDVKSVIISGGGEPLLHPSFLDILYYIKQKGIKIGLNSNGLALDEKKATAILDCCTYFRISLDAGTPEVYKLTHGMDKSDFEKVTGNIVMLAKLKKRFCGRKKISFGTGFLTSEATRKDITSFVRLSKDCGADFAQLRPFTGDFTDVQEELVEAKKLFEDNSFKVAASTQKYSRFSDDIKRNYSKCRGMFFNTVVTADFKVFACLHFRQNQDYFLGDLNHVSLKQIWNSSRIREVFEQIDCSNCPYFCRNDDINRALHDLTLPIVHKEFL